MSNRQFVNYQIEDHIAVVLIDRPPVNALNPQLEEDLQAVFEELRTRSDAGAVIITGGGEKAFIAGADIKTIAGKSPEDAFATSDSAHRMLSEIERFDRVVIAAVNGVALGGGCEIAMACDIRVADESALFGLPEVNLGLLPGAGGTQRLPRLVGIGKAKELILTGDTIDAKEARSIGLVERIVPKGEALAEAKKLAKRVLMRGPLAVINAKKAINEGMQMTFEEGLKNESRLFSELFKTRDLQEGVSAFLEKRKPEFKGR